MSLKGGLDSGARAEAAARLLKVDPDSKSVTDKQEPGPDRSESLQRKEPHTFWTQRLHATVTSASPLI